MSRPKPGLDTADTATPSDTGTPVQGIDLPAPMTMICGSTPKGAIRQISPPDPSGSPATAVSSRIRRSMHMIKRIALAAALGALVLTLVPVAFAGKPAASGGGKPGGGNSQTSNLNGKRETRPCVVPNVEVTHVSGIADHTPIGSDAEVQGLSLVEARNEDGGDFVPLHS